jgi:hypothetical protein
MLMSTPTIAELEAAYIANCDYVGNATKMQAALAALRGLRILRASTMSSGGGALTFEQIGEEIKSLEKQLAASTRAASITLVRGAYF